MSFSENPVINSPFQAPAQHFELDRDGQPTRLTLPGRRPSIQVVPIPASRRGVRQGELNYGDLPSEVKVNDLVNAIRERVDLWRRMPAHQKGVSPETLRLLEHWSRPDRSRSGSVRPDDCARTLGIPRHCVQAFISAGHVDVVTDSDAAIVTDSTLISVASLIALRDRMWNQSREFGGGGTLREAMRRNGDPRDWVAVFDKILAGRVRVRIGNRDGSSLSDALIVQTTDIARYVSRRCAGPGISGINVSCQTAAEIIGATQQFISAAVKSGVIDGEVGVRNSAVPLEGVLKFQMEFVLPEELSEIVGGTKKGIGLSLIVAGYEPVATINRTRVWRRADIEKYIDDKK